MALNDAQKDGSNRLSWCDDLLQGSDLIPTLKKLRQLKSPSTTMAAAAATSPDIHDCEVVTVSELKVNTITTDSGLSSDSLSSSSRDDSSTYSTCSSSSDIKDDDDAHSWTSETTHAAALDDDEEATSKKAAEDLEDSGNETQVSTVSSRSCTPFCPIPDSAECQVDGCFCAGVVQIQGDVGLSEVKERVNGIRIQGLHLVQRR